MRNLIALVLAGVLSTGGAAIAGSSKGGGGGSKPASAPKSSSSVSRPASRSAEGAVHGPTAGGTGSHGPTANGTGSHGPTANGAQYSPAASGAGAHAAPIPAGHNQAISRAAPTGSVDHATRNGSAIRTRQNGKVSDVHNGRNGMDVHHGLNGNRRVSVDRPDHSRFGSERGHPGYAQHPYQFRGHSFARRSYYYHGRAYDRFYHGYMNRGLYMDVYAPAFYYGPAFYGWAYNPWAAPIAFQWGWPGSFWFGYYGYYFAPEPSYPAAPLWLTDYMISSDLQQAYAARQEAGEFAGDPPPPAGGPPALTPAVKYMIASEVKNQLAVENYEAQQNAAQLDVDPGSSGIARLLSDGQPHMFVSGGSLDLVEASGQECAISSGDALQMNSASGGRNGRQSGSALEQGRPGMPNVQPGFDLVGRSPRDAEPHAGKHRPRLAGASG